MDQPLLNKNKDKDKDKGKDENIVIEINDDYILRLKLENDALKIIVKTFQNKIVPIMVLFTIYTIIFSGIFITMIITFKK
jgi:hypothetical protein